MMGDAVCEANSNLLGNSQAQELTEAPRHCRQTFDSYATLPETIYAVVYEYPQVLYRLSPKSAVDSQRNEFVAETSTIF